jgi:hypothetical protein
LSWIITEVTGAVVPALHLADSIPSIVVWLTWRIGRCRGITEGAVIYQAFDETIC